MRDGSNLPAWVLATLLLLVLLVGSDSVCGGGDGAPRRLWERRLVRSPAAAPLLQGDTLFVAGTDRRILCLDARTGDRRWRRSTPGQVGFGIVRADSLLLLGIVSPAPAVVAYECGSGRQRWARRLDGAPVGIVRSGRIVAVLEYGGATHGFDLGDGSEKWERTLKGPMAGMALDGRALRILARRDSLWSLDIADGKRGWAVAVSGTHPSSPVVAGGRVLRLTYDGELVSHDGSTGAEIARASAQAPEASPPTITDEGACVTVATGGEANGFVLPDLGSTWSQATGETVGARAISAGDLWVVACDSGRVLGLRVRDGGVAWTLKLTHAISAPPSVDGGLIGIADEGGRVAVFSLEGGS
jgi:outer membrane protein assembly factor BamB